MVYRVVSTKLTEEEHSQLLDKCNKEGCTPSHLIKNAILKQLDEKNSDKSSSISIAENRTQESSKDLSIDEIRRQLKEMMRE